MRWNTPIDNATLNLRGYVPPVGPVLADAPWPKVMVTVARSSDGETLDLGLRPGPEPTHAPVRLGFTALRPSTSYRLVDRSTGEVIASLASDDQGTAPLDLRITAPWSVRLELAPEALS